MFDSIHNTSFLHISQVKIKRKKLMNPSDRTCTGGRGRARLGSRSRRGPRTRTPVAAPALGAANTRAMLRHGGWGSRACTLGAARVRVRALRQWPRPRLESCPPVVVPARRDLHERRDRERKKKNEMRFNQWEREIGNCWWVEWL
jgi:hypothetical protein